MNGPHTVSIDDLLKISKKLYNTFFPSTDIYSVLLLSLVTVTVYSHKKYHLNAHTRIELSAAIIPDLISFLFKENIISEKETKELTNVFQERQEDIPLILRSYMYAADGLHTSAKHDKKQNNHCLIM